MAVRFAVVAAAGVIMLVGCNPTPAPAGSGNPAPGDRTASPTAAASDAAPVAPSVGSLPVGPGPQEHYTVQAQPAAGSCHYRYENGQPLPDLACTPGAVSPAVTQASLDSTVCKRVHRDDPPVVVRDGQGEEGQRALVRLQRCDGRCRVRPSVIRRRRDNAAGLALWQRGRHAADEYLAVACRGGP